MCSMTPVAYTPMHKHIIVPIGSACLAVIGVFVTVYVITIQERRRWRPELATTLKEWRGFWWDRGFTNLRWLIG